MDPIVGSMDSMTFVDEIEIISPEEAALNDLQVEELSRIAAQQKFNLLQQLIEKRTKFVGYLRRVHEGKVYWMNSVLLTCEEITRSMEPHHLLRRTQQFFYLGLSLAKFLDCDRNAIVIKGCYQLIEEYDHYFSNPTLQGMRLYKKMLRARNGNLYPMESDEINDPNFTEIFRPTIHKWNNKPVYKRFYTPTICFSLDYCAVVISLCETLNLFYGKILDEECSTNTFMFQSIIKLDEKIKNRVFTPILKDLANLSTRVMEKQLNDLL